MIQFEYEAAPVTAKDLGPGWLFGKVMDFRRQSLSEGSVSPGEGLAVLSLQVLFLSASAP